MSTLICLAAWDVSQAASPVVRISIDAPMRHKFGWQYPVTYEFDLPAGTQGVRISRRDSPDAPWAPLAMKSPGESFNGVECVRFDPGAKKAYVSVGFQSAPSFNLEFAGADKVKFLKIARYYDARKAACTLSLDNWGLRETANPGAPWKGQDNDESDKYQAALAVCRFFGIPVSIAINSCGAGQEAFWQTMQAELDRRDQSWEPAVHAQTHPSRASSYAIRGYRSEILGCRDDLLARLQNIPFGQFIFEHILTSGYSDDELLATSAGQFVLVRGWNSHDNPESIDYSSWDSQHNYYGIGGFSYKAYDRVFQHRKPAGRYYREDVESLNTAFDEIYRQGQIFYAMWHPDRYSNSVIYDARQPVEGVQGSSLIQHLSHIAHHEDVWYVANGWLYCYRYVAEHAQVTSQP